MPINKWPVLFGWRIKVKLIYKLFTAFLLTSLMIIALMVGIMQYFASHHFADYVANVEMERLTDVIDILKIEYQKQQGWRHLQQNNVLWEQMLRSRQSIADRDAPPPFSPPTDIAVKRGLSADPMPPPLPLHMISLYDGQKRFIMGRPDIPQNQIFREIRLDGKTVGWLGLSKPVNMRGPLELNFIYQQTRAFILVGCGILNLAASVAFLFSRHLLRPIRQLMFGAHALASRQFDTRVDVHSSDELGDLAADFNKMAITLERYEYMRQQWISDISHELRTPLAILRGEIEAVLDGVRDVGKATLDSLHAEVMRLTKIVNDLHTLTVIDSEALTMAKEPVKIISVMDDMIRVFQPRFSRNGIDVYNEPAQNMEVTVEGDPDRLAQVFSNIFENSLRYTDMPGTVRIRYGQTGSTLRFDIEDSAPGIPDSAMPFIFDRLYRVDRSRSRKEGGSGLGLAISKAIVEAHGGRITAGHSQLGGIRIEIIFPVIKED
jgi:two-component system sensor histidine kinase BaeS